MKYIANIFLTVERKLLQQGFRNETVRMICIALLFIDIFLLVAGIILWPWSAFVLGLAFGSILSSWNFYSLAFFVQQAFPASTGKELVGKQLLRSNLRLFITLILIYIGLVQCQVNPFALAAGLSAPVVLAPIVFFSRSKKH